MQKGWKFAVVVLEPIAANGKMESEYGIHIKIQVKSLIITEVSWRQWDNGRVWKICYKFFTLSLAIYSKLQPATNEENLFCIVLKFLLIHLLPYPSTQTEIPNSFRFVYSRKE